MKLKLRLFMLLLILISCKSRQENVTETIFCTHNVVLDESGKIIPWFTPGDAAYDNFLHLRWDFIKKRVPFSPGPEPRSRYPQYYFYCAFKLRNDSILPDTWINDIGEKIPNWFENARLYYAYTGDSGVMDIIRDFIDYTIDHGTSSDEFKWPGFPYTTTNAGDIIFRGFSDAGRLVLNEIQVDHAGEMGLTYFRMYQFTGNKKYLKEALQVANVLAANVKDGNENESALPYRVVMDDGRVTAPYGANWTGCYMLFENLLRGGFADSLFFSSARDKIRDFLLNYPMKTGYWTDGHSDTDVKSNTYKSNLSASNMTLCLFDYPDLDQEWGSDIPMLIKWTEDNFVYRTADDEPSTMWGANIVGEQDSFNYKMDYQTARYAAACARWYSVSGDISYKEKAYRSLNWVTYCNDSTGLAFESPVSKGILSWWSDCYGECPRMFYHAFAGVPEWAPPQEDHILYSEGILRDVKYAENKLKYTATSDSGVEYIRLSYKPESIILNGKELTVSSSQKPDTYMVRKLGKGDYSITVSHSKAGNIIITG
ncbi:MAG TPA: hypothetical protein VMV47_12425 [Bacteroidales bacterium]|nr:hypothetical protein [Bacteroidales bacterium]